MTQPNNPQRQQLTRRYHALCRQLGMTADERLTLLSAYGVQTSLALTTQQLQQLIRKLQDMRPTAAYDSQLSVMRRRLYAAIGQYLAAQGKESSPELIRAIACRAAGGIERFSDIPLGWLRNLVFAFNRKTQAIANVETLTKAAPAPTPHQPYIHIHSKNI